MKIHPTMTEKFATARSAGLVKLHFSRAQAGQKRSLFGRRVPRIGGTMQGYGERHADALIKVKAAGRFSMFAVGNIGRSGYVAVVGRWWSGIALAFGFGFA